MKRRAFLRSTAGSAWLAACARAGGEPAGDLPGRVAEGIARHRTAGGRIVVTGADGKPVSGAGVKVDQVGHEFLFGCNFFLFDRLREAELAEAYQKRFAALFNYATLPFYWASYEPRQGQPDYARSAKAAGWCRQHGITVKGHPLVWDHPAGNPGWLPDDPEAVGRLSRSRVTDIVSRFRGSIDIWDVVNEAVHLGQANKEQRMSRWATSLGAEKYVSDHMRLARAANPRATLLLNDYRLDPDYSRLLRSVLDADPKIIDAIGLQSHMHGGGWPLQKVWEHCEDFAHLGLPLHFTETTVVSGPRHDEGRKWGTTTPEGEEKQAAYVTSLYRTLFAHPAVRALTWWDFSDRGAWQEAAAGFLRADMSPKPVYDQLLRLVREEWWTKRQGRTEADGAFEVRAYLGTHRVTVEWPNGRRSVQDVKWEAGSANRIEIRPDAG